MKPYLILDHLEKNVYWNCINDEQVAGIVHKKFPIPVDSSIEEYKHVPVQLNFISGKEYDQMIMGRVPDQVIERAVKAFPIEETAAPTP